VGYNSFGMTPTKKLFSEHFQPRPLRQSLDVFVLTALFCALIAAILTIPNPTLAGFYRWLLITECVGLMGTVSGILLVQVPLFRRLRRPIAHLCISCVVIPVGYVGGSSLAFTLLHEPIPAFHPGPRWIIGLGVTALATAVVGYLDTMRKKIAQEAAQRSVAERLAVEAQLRLLRSQLEPHMLFNTLANLRGLVDVEPKLAQKMIDQLIIFLRSSLAASRVEAISLKSEFAQIRAYLEIMSVRLGPRLQYQLELPESLQQVAIPPMLLQPLVENAVKHGIEPKIGDGTINVTAQLTADGIEIVVVDSGLGLVHDVQEVADAGHSEPGAEAHGYGLVHVRERLHAFYGQRASLSLQPLQPSGVRAVIRIPQ
jgi:anti-sigma regulatory factor (Ser/Thr protein kinase)